jgi:4-hydroxy-tetrahydrodipicolinate synthase
MTNQFAGLYVAALTPLKEDFSPNLSAIPAYLDFLASQGCDGALVLGTTGEGTSFAPAERMEIYRAALEVKKLQPDFNIFAGTGTPSMQETIDLTRFVFDIGLDAVVVLPPYYFRKVTEDGLFNWFSWVIQESVPPGGALFGYNFPEVSGVALPIDLLARLKDAFPNRFLGIKNSSSEIEYAQELENQFGKDLIVFTGSDRLLARTLKLGASGCIAASANIITSPLRRVLDAHQRGESDPEAENQLNNLRDILERYPPAASLLKALLAHFFDFPRWPVRPPLVPLSDELVEKAVQEITTVM